LHYLPQEKTLPALFKSNGDKDAISERDILYKVLFDMKKDMVDLKKIVLELYHNQGKATQLVKDHPSLFEGIEQTSEPVVLNIPATESQDHTLNEEEIQDITHETEEDSLSIEKKEKELIIRALQKNNNKRKYAARDLGISERTLYRKIKQYDLDQ
jgi:transcriptional regulator with PAS, ATPase and Fis domain